MSLRTDTIPVTAVIGEPHLSDVYGFTWDAGDPANTLSPVGTQLAADIEFEDGSHATLRVRPLSWVGTGRKMAWVRFHSTGTGDLVVTSGNEKGDEVIPSPYDQPPAPDACRVLSLPVAVDGTGKLVAGQSLDLVPAGDEVALEVWVDSPRLDPANGVQFGGAFSILRPTGGASAPWFSVPTGNLPYAAAATGAGARIFAPWAAFGRDPGQGSDGIPHSESGVTGLPVIYGRSLARFGYRWVPSQGWGEGAGPVLHAMFYRR